MHFLKRLRSLYESLWEQSLQGVALTTLGLTEKPEVVLRHTDLLLRTTEQLERRLPEGTTLLEKYDEVGQELLLLGEPGAGKSTLLLELARQLVGRAEQDPGHPFPIILPLSSWAVKRPPFTEWLSAQLSLIYDVPLQLSRAWIQTDRILPLLDGLDEVPQEARGACIEAITAYRKEHLVPLMVCSRRAEYEQLAPQQRLVAQSAVMIEPLTEQQVETYLEQAGPALAAVRMALQTNPALRELTTTPLMLSVLTLTYAGAAEHDLPQRGTAAEQQQQIFTSYVERMVRRKGDVVHYPLERTNVWLGWLAQQMRQRSQTIFYLDQLQLDWLPTRQRRRYRWGVRLFVGLALGLLVGLLGGLLAGLFGWPGGGLFRGLFVGLVVGLYVGLFIGLGGGGDAEIAPVENLAWSWEDFWLWLYIGVLLGFMAALFGGLVCALVLWPLIGVLGGLHGGLLVAVQPFALRIWLARGGRFPWRAVPFLEDCTTRIFLRRVGGGYGFIHRLLLDHFADMGSTYYLA